MCKSLQETQSYLNDIRDELMGLREIDNLEMYRLLADTGKKLAGLTADERVESNYVHGCISNVYVVAKFRDGCVEFDGESESHVVRGYLAILIEALSGLPSADIVNRTEEMVATFARETELKASLTPNRANAFGNIYQLMVEKSKTFL